VNIVDAIKSGDISAVRAAIKTDPKAVKNARAVLAAGGGAFQAALVLLKKNGADLNAMFKGYRALHSLIQERPHGVSKPTPAALACFDWLLENGADPELPAAWPPARAIIVAAFMGEPAFVKSLLKRAKLDGFAHAALGDVKKFEKTLAKQPSLISDRDIGGLTALQCAAGSRMPRKAPDTFEIAKLLLDAGADPGVPTKSWSDDIDAMYLATGSSNRAIFELLLDHGVDPTEALTHAAWKFNEELSQIALDRGAVIDRAEAGGQPLLNNLIRWGQFKPALWLLAHGASPNIPDRRGWTSMHQAASRGNEKMLQALLEAGGEVKSKDKEGKLPREVATKDKISQMLEGGL
jgi:ankyrin repeat protein